MVSEYKSDDRCSFWNNIINTTKHMTSSTPSVYTINSHRNNPKTATNLTYYKKKDVDDYSMRSCGERTKESKIPIDLSSASTIYINNSITVKKPRLFNQVLTAVSVAFVCNVIGFISAFTSPATEAIKLELEISDKEISWIGGLVPLGALIGGLVGGTLINYAGRKLTILITNVLFLISWICMAVAPSLEYLYVSRAVTGFSVGIGSLAIPIYLGETIEPQVRGTLGLLATAFGNIGILLCFVLGTYLSWRNLAWFGAGLTLPFFFLVFLIPETPRWYASKKKEQRAHSSLQWLRNTQDIHAEFSQLFANEKYTSSSCCISAKELFEIAHLKPLVIALGLMFFQQLSGITPVIYYTTDIFKMSGSSIDKRLSTIIVGIVNFVSTFIATVLIDRLGRKILLYISSIFMAITLTILGAYFYLLDKNFPIQEYGWVPLVSFVVYVLAFSLGFGPIPWLMLGEIFPAKIKGFAASATTAFHWMCTFIVTKTFTDIIDATGTYGTFWIFAIMCIASFVFVCVWVPETKGKTFEEIEMLLNVRKEYPQDVKNVS